MTNNKIHQESLKHSTSASQCTPLLPTEIWLQILEHDNPKHLFLSVRHVSRTYKACVERLFASKYLSGLSIALSLPRRDPATGKLRWRGDPIPGSQLKMTYKQLSEDERRIYLESPVVLKDRSSEKTVEELREAYTLPKERLEEAPAYVSMSTHSFTGLTIDVPVRVDWDEMRKIWVWELDWRMLLSRFYDAKERQSKRWPSSTCDRGQK